MSRDVLREKVTARIGEAVFYRSEVINMISNLGGGHTFPNSLKPYAIRPCELGFEPRFYELDKNITVYPESVIWGYLQASRRVRLEERGIGSFDDIVERGLHSTELGLGGSRGKIASRRVIAESIKKQG